MYTWQRGRSGRCWVRDLGVGRREEVDGEYLLCAASVLIVEVRANADWLPITVQWNGHAFEGSERLGARTLQIEAEVMMEMLCGGGGRHMGLVY